MALKMSKKIVSPDLLAQRKYYDKVDKAGFQFQLVVADAFIRGIRDIGYKHTGTALFELADNAIQAEASKIHVLFGFGPDGSNKPDRLAVIDDGHGMDPKMIRLSAIWGGTHREGDRTGFGRYGYGEPSACLSQGRSFTVYSRVADRDWHQVTIDVDAIGAGAYTNASGVVEVPEARPTELPDWVAAYYRKRFGNAASGTVVIIERLDRLTWKTAPSLERSLLEHFGLTYRNSLRQVDIEINGKKVEPTDPLFLTPGHRFYDLTDVRAEALPPLAIEVKNDDGKTHVINVRFSYMPPDFQRTNGKLNARFPVMKSHSGIIFMRAGRQIDVVSSVCPWGTFVNFDRNWGVEVDFPPHLDEEFSITTSKQHIRPSERMWGILKQEGVWAAIEKMRARFKQEKLVSEDKDEQQDKEPRTSEKIMEDVAKFKTRLPVETDKRRLEGEEALEKEVKKRAEVAGMPEEHVKQQLQADKRKYVVTVESLPGAPFYRVEQVGGQRVLRLNSAHRFFTDVYRAPGATPRLRSAIELLLWVLGECELDSTDDRRLFYQVERAEWTKGLAVALDRLDTIDSVVDAIDAAENDVDVMPTSAGIAETV